MNSVNIGHQEEVLRDIKCDNSTIKIGLALHESNSPITFQDIKDNFPVRVLAGTKFILLSGNFEQKPPTLMNIMDIRNLPDDEKYSVIIMQQVDILMSFDNEFKGFAISTGVPVWLLKSADDDLLAGSENIENSLVSVFNKQENETWGNVFRRMSFYRLMYSEQMNFKPIDEVIILNTDDRPVSINCNLQTTSNIDNIFRRANADFLQVYIETTTVCNLSCSYCPISRIPRPKEFMAEDTFCKIIDSIWDYNKNFDGSINPHFYGEPLLDKRLESFVAYTRWRLPKARIDIYTNGELLTVSRYSSLKKAGVNAFHVSIHRAESQAGILAILDQISTEYPDDHSVECNVLYNRKYLMNRGGLVDVDVVPYLDRYYSRCASYRDLQFDVRGNAVLCCNDYSSSHQFGNIHNASIKDIWQSPVNCETRNALLFGYLPLPICKKCKNIVAEMNNEQN